MALSIPDDMDAEEFKCHRSYCEEPASKHISFVKRNDEREEIGKPGHCTLCRRPICNIHARHIRRNGPVGDPFYELLECGQCAAKLPRAERWGRVPLIGPYLFRLVMRP
jgi:hypothetical protein